MVAVQVWHCKGIRDRRSTPATRRSPAASCVLLALTLVPAAQAKRESSLQELLALPDPPVTEIRAVLRSIQRGDSLACDAPDAEDRARLLALPDDEIQRMAALLTLNAPPPPHPEDLGPLVQYVDQAAPDALRWIVERAERPIHDPFLPIARTMHARPEPFVSALGAELLARFRAELAEPILLEWIQSESGGAFALPAQLEALGRIAGPASADGLARHLADSNPEVAQAAGLAFQEVRSRLLALARPADELEFVRAGLRLAPGDLELHLKEALTLGVYLERPEAALHLLQEEFERHLPGDWGQGEQALAELLLGQAVVLFFGGAPEAAAARLNDALLHLHDPPPHQKTAATLQARIRLVAGLFALADPKGGEPAARVHFQRALAEAPYRAETCSFDQAMLGVFGPLIVLDRLRRTGRVSLQLRFYEVLEQELWNDEPGVALGLPEPTEGPLPRAGSDEAAVESTQVKSWIPWWRMQALLDAGELEPARAIGLRVIRALRNTNLWDNRDLAAHCALLLGQAEAFEGNQELALDAYREALAVFEEIDQAFSREDLEARPGRFPPGAPPYRPPYRALRAQALVGQSEVLLCFNGQPAQIHELAQRAARLAPWYDRALLALSFAEVRAGDRDRARRLLESLPPEADLLADLSHLAAALDEPELSDLLFETHLAWNALTQQRKEIARAWRRRLSP